MLICSSTYANTVLFVCPDAKPTPPVLYGIQKLEETFSQKGWSTERLYGIPVNREDIDLEVIVAAFDPTIGEKSGMGMLKNVVHPKPESFSILAFSKDGRQRIYAVGSDHTGAMYAALNLVEQIKYASADKSIINAIQEVKQQSSIPVRGIKVVLFDHAMRDPLSWVHSHEFWVGYLDMLAANHFNYLALHGVYSIVNAEYYNLYSYFYPDLQQHKTNISSNQSKRIVTSIKEVIELAQERGINVSLINEWAPGLTPDKLNDGLDHFQTNQTVLTNILDDFPQLKGIGMQIQIESYEFTSDHLRILQPLIDSARQPIFFLHPGPTSDESVINTLNQFEGRSVLSVEYNADFLGQPYQVTGDRDSAWNQSSYQNFYTLPRKYGYISEIRSSGTHRIFPWGHYSQIKQILKSTVNYNANGFVIEPLSTFSAKIDAFTNKTQSSLSYYKWTYERDWYWYLLWGRLAYNLDETPELFDMHFQNHFGNDVGKTIWQALQDISEVVPAISAFAQDGPDWQNFSPELEAPFSLQEILHKQTFDPFTVRNLQEETNVIQTGIPNTKRSPIEHLEKATEKALNAIELLQQVESSMNNKTQTADNLLLENEAAALQEWEAWKLDFESLAALGASWRDQLKAALAWNLFLYTGDLPSLIMASDFLKSSQTNWQRLQKTSSRHYRPLLVTFGNKSGLYHWQDNSGPWDNDLAVLTNTYNEWIKKEEWNQGVGHLPVNKTKTNQPIVITYSIPPKVEVNGFFVNYKNSYGDSGQVKMDQSNLDGVYYAEIPSSVVKEGLIHYYFIARVGGEDVEILSPTENAPFITAVTDDDQPPMIVDINSETTASSVNVNCNFSDPSGVYNATLFWKPVPATKPWNNLPMQRSGSNFKASIPLDEKGIQYAIEVVDNYGNARRFPSAPNEVPYEIVFPER